MGNEANTTPTTPQAGDEGQAPQPQAGNTTPPEPQAGEGQHGKPATRNAEDYEREIAELRKQSAGYRTKAKQFDELNAKLEAEKLSEAEKLQKQLADYQKQHSDLTRQLQEARISSTVQLQATRLGFADPGDATRFLDVSALEFDDNGIPTNVEEQLKAILKAKPYLAGKAATQPTSGGATNPSRSQSDPGTGEITESYVADIMSGKIAWNTLTPERKSAVLQWQTKHSYRF